MLVTEAWNDIPRLIHGFLSRTPPPEPGTTTDWGAAVAAHGLPPVRVVVARQVHGARIATIVEPPDAALEADGLLTATAGVAVGVVTADCVPVLLVDEPGRVGAAVHAGWRGTLAGIVSGAVASTTAQTGTRASDLRAAIGPAVGPCCYEVGREVREAFVASHGEALVAPAFTTSRPRPHLDLRLLVRLHLELAGVSASAIETLGPCTVCDPTYASYRRDGPRAGRQLSFIGWK
jgi:YfiH family protein